MWVSLGRYITKRLQPFYIQVQRCVRVCRVCLSLCLANKVKVYLFTKTRKQRLSAKAFGTHIDAATGKTVHSRQNIRFGFTIFIVVLHFRFHFSCVKKSKSESRARRDENTFLCLNKQGVAIEERAAHCCLLYERLCTIALGLRSGQTKSSEHKKVCIAAKAETQRNILITRERRSGWTVLFYLIASPSSTNLFIYAFGYFWTMSKVFSCIVLLSLANIATSLYSTVRPHRHMHHGRHKHYANQTNNASLHLNGMPLDTSGTTRSPMSLSSAAQRLFLINSNHHQPTPTHGYATAFPPNYSRWPTVYHPHRVDFGKDWRTRGPRTFAADGPYTTSATPASATATAPTSLRPEHRFHIQSKPHVGYVCVQFMLVLRESHIYSFKLLINSVEMFIFYNGMQLHTVGVAVICFNIYNYLVVWYLISLKIHITVGRFTNGLRRFSFPSFSNTPHRTAPRFASSPASSIDQVLVLFSK